MQGLPPWGEGRGRGTFRSSTDFLTPTLSDRAIVTTHSLALLGASDIELTTPLSHRGLAKVVPGEEVLTVH